jgi:hypothetical protein
VEGDDLMNAATLHVEHPKPPTGLLHIAGSTRIPGGGGLTVKSHDISRRSSHRRATSRATGVKPPGLGVLTASFATRGPRVQIPSAPQNTLVGALSASSTLAVWSIPLSVAPRVSHRIAHA